MLTNRRNFSLLMSRFLEAGAAVPGWRRNKVWEQEGVDRDVQGVLRGGGESGYGGDGGDDN